jgi:hypothetical protein
MAQLHMYLFGARGQTSADRDTLLVQKRQPVYLFRSVKNMTCFQAKQTQSDAMREILWIAVACVQRSQTDAPKTVCTPQCIVNDGRLSANSPRTVRLAWPRVDSMGYYSPNFLHFVGLDTGKIHGVSWGVAKVRIPALRTPVQFPAFRIGWTWVDIRDCSGAWPR